MISAKVQYVIVFVILGIVVAWIIYRLIRKPGSVGGACAGCALADACKKKKPKPGCDKDIKNKTH